MKNLHEDHCCPFHLLILLRRFGWSADDMVRSRFVISVNDGLRAGSNDQHSSINLFHSVSQRSGIGGLSVLPTIPPSQEIHSQ